MIRARTLLLATTVSGLAWFCPLRVDAGPIWNLVSVKDAPCRTWNMSFGRCLDWYSQHQYFPDHASAVAAFSALTGAMNDLDKRVTQLEAEVGRQTRTDDVYVKPVILDAVQTAPCILWDGADGACLQWYTEYRFYPEFADAAAGFKLYDEAVADLQRRLQRLEAHANPPIDGGSDPIPAWSLIPVETTPCFYWDGTQGHCQDIFPKKHSFPDFYSMDSGFHVYANAAARLSRRIDELEGRRGLAAAPLGVSRVLARTE